MKNKIDFFILGSPKTGTTALHAILNNDKNVFLPNFKEPHFFADDLGGYKAHSEEVEFMRLYSDSKSKLNGDASIFSLYSSVAVDNILKHNPEAKFIVMIRRQYEAVPSFHGQVLFTQDETESDLEKAWDLTEKRRNNKEVPSSCKSSKILDYKSMYSYAEQLERLYKKVKKEHVLVVLHDDFKTQNKVELQRIADFLSLNKTNLKNIIANKNEVNRFPLIARLLRHPPKSVKSIKRLLLGRRGKGVYHSLLKLNSKEQKRTFLHNTVKAKIIGNYFEDIEKLEVLLNRDLTSWKTND